MNTKVSVPSEACWRKWHIVSVFFLFCVIMVRPPIRYRWETMFSLYGQVLVLGIIALFLFYRGLRNRAEVNILFAYAAWLLITRWLNGDFFVWYDASILVSRLLCPVVLAVGLMMDAQGRRRFLNLLFAAIGIYFSVIAFFSLAACLTGSVIRLSNEAVFGLETYGQPGHINYIECCGAHRNIVACWFYIALNAMLYLFFSCRNKLWRIPTGFAIVLFYIGITLCFCRSICIATAGSAALLAILLAFRHLPLKRLWQKAGVIVLCAALVIPLFYKSYDLTAGMMSRVSSVIISSTSSSTDSSPDTASPHSSLSEPSASDAKVGAVTAQGMDFSDPRDVLTNTTLTGRTDIWKAGFSALQADPIRLLRGSLQEEIVSYVRTFLPWDFGHMHNSYLEVLMLTGVIGLFLVVVFSLLLLVRMLHLFFTDDAKARFADKLLVIPLAGMFVYSTVEVTFFVYLQEAPLSTEVREMFFFLTAGMVLGISYDILPSLRRKKLR